MVLLIALLVFAQYTPGLIDVYHFPKLLCLLTIVTLSAISKPLPKTSLDRPILVWLAVVLLTSLTAEYPGISFFGQSRFYFTGFIPSLAVAACFWLTVGEDHWLIEDAFLLSTAAACIIGLAQRFGYWLPYDLFSGDRVYSTLGSPVFMSSLLAMAFPLALARKDWRVLIPITAGLYLTGSRAGMVGAAAGSALLLPPLWAILALFAGALAVARVSAIRPPSSDQGRLQLYRIAWMSFKDRPWLGWGPENFPWSIARYRDALFDAAVGPRYSNCYAHNAYLQTLSGMGLAGLIAFCNLQYHAARLIASTRRPVLGAAAGLLAYSLFQPTPFYAKAILAMLIGSSLPASEDRPASSSAVLVLALLVGLGLAARQLAANRVVVAGINYSNGILFESGSRLAPVMLR